MNPALPPLALRLGCEAAALAAVIQVESAGAGLQAGRPVIRLEAHLLWRRVPEHLRPQVDAAFRVLGPEPWQGHRVLLAGAWTDYHKSQAMEWQAYQFAIDIDAQAAVEATSWGLGQVLGSHWRHLGYGSVEEFLAAQMTEAGQLDTMARLIEADPSLLGALRRKDWPAFAAAYNGPGQVPRYTALLEGAYRRHSCPAP